MQLVGGVFAQGAAAAAKPVFALLRVVAVRFPPFGLGLRVISRIGGRDAACCVSTVSVSSVGLSVTHARALGKCQGRDQEKQGQNRT
jgi:hypothetical protein